MTIQTKSYSEPQHVLVLGAYGQIGYGVARHLQAAGHMVTGLGRNRETALRVGPDLTWVYSDMRDLCDAEDWSGLLDGFSVVVNCAGALQDGPDDALEAVHHHAIAALAKACAARGSRLLQISAVGVRDDAATAFLASKARGDAAIRASGCDHVIFRPGLVLSQRAYGGTALLRMLAAIPVVQPIALPDTPVQTVALSDVAQAVTYAVEGRCPPAFECDLVEGDTHSLRDVLAATRNWLGFASARFEIVNGPLTTTLASRIADALSFFGWRSPLRSTAMTVMAEGVRGDPSVWASLGLPPMRPMPQTFAALQAGPEDRLAARMSLMMPLLVVTLFGFWLVSGLVGLWQLPAAAQVLEEAGWPGGVAMGAVIFWSLVDIALALAIIRRRSAKAACWAMIAVSLIYLGAATLITPYLWADPLGPLVKVVPAILLALVTRVALDSR